MNRLNLAELADTEYPYKHFTYRLTTETPISLRVVREHPVLPPLYVGVIEIHTDCRGPGTGLLAFDHNGATLNDPPTTTDDGCLRFLRLAIKRLHIDAIIATGKNCALDAEVGDRVYTEGHVCTITKIIRPVLSGNIQLHADELAPPVTLSGYETFRPTESLSFVVTDQPHNDGARLHTLNDGRILLTLAGSTAATPFPSEELNPRDRH